MNRLEGKVAFITGVARGMGRAEAVRLAQEGADIIGIDNCETAPTADYPGPSRADLDEAAAAIEATGRRARLSVVDVRDAALMTKTLHAGVDELGGLDIAVANAGICTAGRFWEITDEAFDEMIAINLKGVFNTLRAVAPIMIEQDRGGSIIATSSTAGLRGLPFLAAYAAAKHGVVGLVRTLANEVAEYKIRVNTIHPTGVMTGLNVTSLFDLIQSKASTLGPIFMNAMPDPPAMQPEDVAATVAWLASDDAKYVTGAQIPVDMGTMGR
jgi:SDR family mycofactocin-dependent oxidoreductase